MDDHKTIRIVVDAEVPLDADENAIGQALVEAAEKRDDVLAAWTP